MGYIYEDVTSVEVKRKLKKKFDNVVQDAKKIVEQRNQQLLKRKGSMGKGEEDKMREDRTRVDKESGGDGSEEEDAE